MKLKFGAIKLLFIVSLMFIHDLAWTQMRQMDNGNFLLFPEWEKGDTKLFDSKTITTTIINADTTITESISRDLITIYEKTPNHFLVGIQDLDSSAEEYDDIIMKMIGEASGNLFIGETLNYILGQFYKSSIVDQEFRFKVNKWGYYEGLDVSLDLDSLNSIIANEIMEIEGFLLPEDVDLDHFFTSNDIEKIKQLWSQSFYENIRPLHMPYDKELSENSVKRDTLDFLIPWFKLPIPCVLSTKMSYNQNEIEIKIGFDYIIVESDFANTVEGVSFSKFGLNLESNFILDYSSKWIKSISSSSRRIENDSIFIESFEANIADK